MKIVETLKTSVFHFVMVNLVNKSVLQALITTGVCLKGGGWKISPSLSRKQEKNSLILRESALCVAIYWLKLLI